MSFLLSLKVLYLKKHGFILCEPRFLMCWPPGVLGCHLRKKKKKPFGHTSFLKSRQVCQRFFFRIPGGSRTAHPGSCSQPAASLPLSAPLTPPPHFPVQRIFRFPRLGSRTRGALWCNYFGSYAAPLDAMQSGCLNHCSPCADQQHASLPSFLLT